MRPVVLLTLASLVAGPALTARAEPATGRYVVVLRKGADPDASARAHAQREGVHVERTYRHALMGYAATVREDRVADLRREPDVAYVQHDVVYHAAVQTVDDGVKRVHALTSATKGTGVNVAVVDTGIDIDHPDLASNIAGGVNCSNASSFDDLNGHGTHVAGTLAAKDNSIGVRGVAPEAKLWAVRVLDQNGNGSLPEVLCGVDFVDSKAPLNGGSILVANMSFEIDFQQPIDDGNCGIDIGDALHEAICQLVADRVTVVAAAGNHQHDIDITSPAAYDEVITVSALTDSDGLPCGEGSSLGGAPDDTFATSFSNFATAASDKAHMIGAPGVLIESTTNDGSTGLMSGTSMAAPHVSGAAALYLQSHPGAPASEVKAALLDAAEPKDVNFNNECAGGAFSHTDPSPSKHPERVLAIGQWVLPIEAVTPGVARGNAWYLVDGFGTGTLHTFPYGSAGDIKVVGDWNGDGIDTPGVIRGNVWYLANGFPGTTMTPFAYGKVGDNFVVGDWDGDSNHTDTPGVVRGNNWYLADSFGGPATHTFAYGAVSDSKQVGDWDGDGDDNPGVVRGNLWYLAKAFPGAAVVGTPFAFGKVGDRHVVGDWDGEGKDTPGIIRGNIWFLNNGLDGGADIVFAFGKLGDWWLAGDWDGLTP